MSKEKGKIKLEPYIGTVVLALLIAGGYIIYQMFGYVYRFTDISYTMFKIYTQTLFIIVFILVLIALIVKKKSS